MKGIAYDVPRISGPAFDMLLALARRKVERPYDPVVSKADLMTSAWPGVNVADAAFYKGMSKLERALRVPGPIGPRWRVRHSGARPVERLIANVRGRGYFLKGKVNPRWVGGRAQGNSDRDLALDDSAPIRDLSLWLVYVYREASRDWQTIDEETWRKKYDWEAKNLTAALEWAFGPFGDVQLGLELVSLTAHLWFLYDKLSEHDRWIALADQHKHRAPPDVHGRILLHRSSSMSPGDRKSLVLAQQAIELFKIAGDAGGLAYALVAAAYAAFHEHKLEPAAAYISQAFEALRAVSSPRARERCLQVYAIISLTLCRFDLAEEAYREAAAISRQLRSDKDLFAALSQLSEVYFARGDIEAAIANARHSLADFEPVVRGSWESAHVSGQLAAYLLLNGQLVEGRRLAIQSLEESIRIGYQRSYIWAIERVALAEAESGQVDRATRLMGYIDAYYTIHGASKETTPQAVYHRLRWALESKLSKPEVNALLTEGAGMSLQKALHEALSGLH